jgi:hypothetical protein
LFSKTKSYPPLALLEDTIDFPASELILSWNAIRPKEGSYLFYVQLKIENSWSEWFPYAEWGATIQKSNHAETSLVKVHQDVVRAKEERLLQAFRIKVECSGSALLSGLDALHVSLSHPPLFSISKDLELPSVLLPLQSFYSQQALDHPRRRDLCSPTSLSMAIDFLNSNQLMDPIAFASKVHDQEFDIYGNWVLNVAAAYPYLPRYRYACFVDRLLNFKALHHRLSLGFPVVTSVKGPLPGSATPYQYGHLLVVRGYHANERRVVCVDPAFPSNTETLTSYDLDDFLTAWGRRFNLSYILARWQAGGNKCL